MGYDYGESCALPISSSLGEILYIFHRSRKADSPVLSLKLHWNLQGLAYDTRAFVGIQSSFLVLLVHLDGLSDGSTQLHR